MNILPKVTTIYKISTDRDKINKQIDIVANKYYRDWLTRYSSRPTPSKAEVDDEFLFWVVNIETQDYTRTLFYITTDEEYNTIIDAWDKWNKERELLKLNK